MMTQTVEQLDDGHWYIVPAVQQVQEMSSFRGNNADEYRYVEAIRGVRVDSNMISDAPIILSLKFPTSGYSLDEDQKQQILRLPHVYRKFIVEGHTDSSGGVAINQRISLKRAQQVARLLVQGGAHDVVVKALSDSQPVCRENTAECSAINRRVIIRGTK